MNLNLSWRFPWVRPGVDYADYGRDLLERQAAHLAAPRGRIQDTALVRAVGGIYRRAFEGAEIDTAGAVVDVGEIAETLVTWGHYVGEIEIRGGLVHVLPRWPDDVRLTAAGIPSRFVFGSRRVDPAGVVWCRYMSDLAGQGPISGQETPWYRSHWDRSPDTVAAYLHAVRFLAEELGLPSMRLLPGDSLADLSTADDPERLKETWRVLSDGKFRGKVALVPNRNTAARPSTTLDPNRYGPDVSQWTLRAVQYLNEQLAALCGVPLAVLGDVEHAGTDTVEAWRQFRRFTLQPVADRIAAELTEKVEAPVAITFPDTNAADVRARAGAVKMLVDAGMSVDDAKMEAGL